MLPYTLSNTDVVLSALEEELFPFSVLSTCWTICTDWDAALISLVCDGKFELFRSLSAAAKADWAVERSGAERTAERRHVGRKGVVRRLLPLAFSRFWFRFCKVWNAACELFRSPNLRPLLRRLQCLLQRIGLTGREHVLTEVCSRNRTNCCLPLPMW